MSSTLLLSLLPSLDNERKINISVLLDVAPDREELLLSDRPIDDIRNALKIRENVAYDHWLHRVQRRKNVEVKDATEPRSLFLRNDDQTNEQVAESSTVSTYDVRPFGYPPSASPAITTSELDVSDGRRSNTVNVVDNSDSLISPRPVGPTHMLIAYQEINAAKRQYAEIIEMPINDLLFLLNVPNIAYDYSRGLHVPILPRRMKDKLPSVLIAVPHLKTFPELIVYLHTKNQASLFRELIPEWARDVMHPLPILRSPVGASLSDREEYAPTCCFPQLNFFKSKSRSSSPRLDLEGSVAARVQSKEAVNSVAAELAEAAKVHSATATSMNNPLHDIAATLDALHDNLSHIGYLNQALWGEMEIYRSILRRAITHQSRVDLGSEQQGTEAEAL